MSMIMGMENTGNMVILKLWYLININLSKIIICKNGPNVINIRFNITDILCFCKPFLRTIILNMNILIAEN